MYVCADYVNYESHKSLWMDVFFFIKFDLGTGSGLVQWLASRTTDQGVPGSNPCRVAVRCGLKQVIFTPCLVLV